MKGEPSMRDSADGLLSSAFQGMEQMLLTVALVFSLVAWVVPHTARVFDSIRWAISAHVIR